MLIVAGVIGITKTVFEPGGEKLNEAKTEVARSLKQKYGGEFKVEDVVYQSKGGKPLFDFDSPTDTTGEYYFVFSAVDRGGVRFGVHYGYFKQGVEIVDLYEETKALEKSYSQLREAVAGETGLALNNQIEVGEVVDHYSHGQFNWNVAFSTDEKFKAVADESFIEKLASAGEVAEQVFEEALGAENLSASGFKFKNPSRGSYSELSLIPSLTVRFRDKREVNLINGESWGPEQFDRLVIKKDGDSRGCVVRSLSDYQGCSWL